MSTMTVTEAMDRAHVVAETVSNAVLGSDSWAGFAGISMVHEAILSQLFQKFGNDPVSSIHIEAMVMLHLTSLMHICDRNGMRIETMIENIRKLEPEMPSNDD